MATLSDATAHSTAMIGRELRHTVRYPTMLIASILTPVVMLLLFLYVFGGTLDAGLGTANGGSYAAYLVPGILMLTIAAGTSTIAVGVNTDKTEGIIDRFRTMPITRGAVLAGHVVGGVLRTLVTVTVVIAVAFAVGFRPSAGLGGWLGAAGIVVGFSLALALLSVAIGLVAESPAGANGGTLPFQFLLPFLSSAFVPTDSMPAGIRWFAEYQPFTPIVESIRSTLTGTPTDINALVAASWCAVLAAVGCVWALKAFRRG